MKLQKFPTQQHKEKAVLNSGKLCFLSAFDMPNKCVHSSDYMEKIRYFSLVSKGVLLAL